MNKPRLLLPVAVAGLVLASAFVTAALVNAAEVPVQVATAAVLRSAEVDDLFDLASMSAAMRAKRARADQEIAPQSAETAEMFTVVMRPTTKKNGSANNLQGEHGKGVYLGLCFACHLPDGKGVANVFPPLAGSDFLLADRDRAIQVVLKGLVGPVTVNGVTYNSAMPPLETTLAEQQIADVLTYVTNDWGNKGAHYTLDDVRRVKQLAEGNTSVPVAR
jgi:nitrite reductase (NO-forming)